MKKILSLLVLLFAFAANALATVVWEGNVVLQNYTRSEEVVLPAAAFADAKVGDKLVVTFTEYTADSQSWRQVELWTYDAATGEMVTSLCTGHHIAPGDTKCSFTIDEAMLDALKQGIVAMAGTGYILTKVELVANDGVLWEGTSVFANWTPSATIQLPSTAFVTAQVGDEIEIAVKALDPNAWAAVRLEAGDWTGAIGDADHVVGATDESVTIKLTEQLLGNLKSVGAVVVGDNIVVTKLTLRTAGGGSGEDADPSVIWSGKLSFNNWSASENVQIPASAFADAVVGDKLVLTCQKINAEAWGAILPEIGNFGGKFPGFESYFELPDGDVHDIVIDIPADVLATMKEKGIDFSGDNLTLTKVRLVSGSGEDVDPSVIWSGKLSFNNWSASQDVQIPASAFADAVVGDKLVLTCQKINAEAWGAILPEIGNFGGKFPGFESYFELPDGDVHDIVIDIPADVLATMKEKGIDFSGENITLTKVRLVSGEAEGIKAVTTTGKTVREYQLNQFIRIVDGKKVFRF